MESGNKETGLSIGKLTFVASPWLSLFAASLSIFVGMSGVVALSEFVVS